MKFNFSGFLKLFILSLAMALGFLLIYALILGVPTTEGAMLVLVLLSASSVFTFLWVCKED